MTQKTAASSSQTEFNLNEAIRGRDEGIARVKAKNADFVESARGLARMIARSRPDRIITADDVRAELSKHPEIAKPTHYNAYGAIFCRNDDFEFVGYTKSEQKQGHGNLVRKWRLKTA